jgi:hypothetical protein
MSVQIACEIGGQLVSGFLATECQVALHTIIVDALILLGESKHGVRWPPLRVTMVQRVLGIVGQQNRCHSEVGAGAGKATLHLTRN